MNSRAKCLLLSFLAVVLLPGAVTAQEADHSAMIENALSAAPAAIAAGAAVVDSEGNVIREGSNGYTCMADNPALPDNSPMCLDEGWLAWVH
ncbi:MAG: hypothetical protein E4H28_08690, partial [Gemmatimonadales bacterium]